MNKVFVNGTFDLLHTGHLDLLKFAKSLGSHLHVALDTDRRIRAKKGLDRPVNNELVRYRIMSDIKYVDSVSLFDSDDDLIDTVKNYEPNVMVVGSDWIGKPIIGSQYSKSVVYFDRVNNESTTATIERYVNRRFMRR